MKIMIAKTLTDKIMKKTIIPSLLLMILMACNAKPQEDKMKELIAANKADVDFDLGSTPANFSAKTIDGKAFNSVDNKGKYWVVFVYPTNYLTKSESYDMEAELNETHKLFGDKFPMIGIVTGLSDDEKATKKLFDASKIEFKQIDNTEGPDKEKSIKENIFCTPAKIIINPEGKVIYNGCGGKTKTLDYKLDSLIKADKL